MSCKWCNRCVRWCVGLYATLADTRLQYIYLCLYQPTYKLRYIFTPFKPDFTSSSTTSRGLLSQVSALQWIKMIWCSLKIKENCHVLLNRFHGNFRFKTLGWRKIKSVSRVVKWYFNASWGVNPLTAKLFNLNSHPLEVVDRVSETSEWKIFRFDKMEGNSFQIVLIDVTLWLYHV